MSILNSPVHYSNKLSQPETNSTRWNYFPFNTGEVTSNVTTSAQNDCIGQDIKFYRKRDVEMAWSDLFQNDNNTQNCVCSIVQETGPKNALRHHGANGALGNLRPCQCPHSKKPRTNGGVNAMSNFNLTSPRISATAKTRTSRKSSHSNPYRRIPGKQKRVYFIESSDTTAEYQNNSLCRAPILVNAYNIQTELIHHNDEKSRRNEAEALPGGVPELSAKHLYEQNLIKDDIAALTHCPKPTEFTRSTSSSFRLKTSERTSSEVIHLGYEAPQIIHDLNPDFPRWSARDIK